MRIDCADDAANVCDEVADAARATRASRSGRSAVAGFGGEGVLRIKVGPWAELRRDAAVRRIEEGPRVSGVYAKPAPDGRSIALLDPEGRPCGRSAPAAG